MNTVGILESVTSDGYMENQNIKNTTFINNNDQNLNSYLESHPYQNKLAKDKNFGYDNSCADTYPVYSPEYVKKQQSVLTQEDFSDVIPHNDPTNNNLLDMQSRPLTDFFHNNMVPFAKKFSQNMAGTGIATGNYVDGSTVAGNQTGVNSGFDYSTPNATKLGAFSGNDPTYLHKRETGPFFSPAEQQTNWVRGSPLFRPDEDRYTTSLNNLKHDQTPVEAIKVGPGLNISSDIPASGGFHEFTRILPNNVNNYKANQLPGQVKTGKYFSAALPTSYPGIGTEQDEYAPGVVKNKPDTFWDQTRRPTMTTKVAFQENLDYNIPDYQADFKPSNATRDQISFGLGNIEYKKTQERINRRENFANDTTVNNVGYACVNEEVTIGQGPLGSRVPLDGQRSETWMSIDNNIRSRSDCQSQPTGNPQRSGFGQGNIMANWYVNETDRGTVNPQNVMQLNLSREGHGPTTQYLYDDLPKTSTGETTQYSYAGNASRGNDGEKFWTYVDEMPTTNSETTQYSYAGNAAKATEGTKFWTYTDEVPTTNKETTEYSYTSNPAIGSLAVTNRFQFMGDDE
jgi:hypothetical protein